MLKNVQKWQDELYQAFAGLIMRECEDAEARFGVVQALTHA